MPKKRGKPSKMYIKQKKAAATRLIQISLVMDDNIYEHKEISEHDAESYIKEIASFNMKYLDDPRSLQVIDKLTTFMKGIVQEHKEKRQLISHGSSPKIITNCLSFEGENKDNLTRPIPEDNSSAFMETDLSEVIDNTHCQELNNGTENEEGIKSTLDLTILDSDAEVTYTGTKATDSQKSYPYDASQDLFNTMYTQDINQNTNDNSQCAQSHESSINSKHFVKTDSQTPNYSIHQSQSISTNSNYLQIIPNVKTPLDDSYGVLGNILSEDSRKTTEVSVNNTEKGQQRSIHLTTNNISNIQLDNLDIPVGYNMKPTVNTVSNIRDEKIKKADNKKGKQKIKQENVKQRQKKRNPRKKKNLSKKAIDKPPSDNIENSSITYEKSIDLTWIDNLKYVREISTAENHKRPMDLSVRFWENYTLPNDWDDTEFEYKT